MKKGFTLLELLIVVIIIGILALIAVPQFFSAADRAKDAKAKQILTSFRTAILAYRSVYGSWPAAVAAGGTLVVDMDTTSAGNDIEVVIPTDASDPDYQYAVAAAGVTTAAKEGTGTNKSWSLNCATGVFTGS